jgi:hypothetical protein
MTILQIDERKTYDGIVEILWIKENDETIVHVESLEFGEFNIPTSKVLALDVFNHPFAYRRNCMIAPVS